MCIEVTKTELSTSEDPTGFIQQLVNCVACHVAGRKDEPEENGRFLKTERGWDVEVINKDKRDSFGQGHLPLGDKRVYRVDYLAGADQEIPDWLRLHSWGGWKLQLGSKSWFGDVRFCTSDFI